jgi:hypothetical protein
LNICIYTSAFGQSAFDRIKVVGISSSVCEPLSFSSSCCPLGFSKSIIYAIRCGKNNSLTRRAGGRNKIRNIFFAIEDFKPNLCSSSSSGVNGVEGVGVDVSFDRTFFFSIFVPEPIGVLKKISINYLRRF